MCFNENPFTNPEMYLQWIWGFDISPMWTSHWFKDLESASSELYTIYYTLLFAKCSLYRLYIIHFCSPAEWRLNLFGKHFNSTLYKYVISRWEFLFFIYSGILLTCFTVRKRQSCGNAACEMYSESKWSGTPQLFRNDWCMHGVIFALWCITDLCLCTSV